MGRPAGKHAARIYAGKGHPDKGRDALGESNSDPEVKHLSDAMKTKGNK
jgi:hypothetical protein